MTFYAATHAGSINLQATLSASSSGVGDALAMAPHHPITCSTSSLSLTEDGIFACEHGKVEAGDLRTQLCIDHSIALLLIELLRAREGGDVSC